MATVALRQEWRDGRLQALLDDFNSRTSVNDDGAVRFSDFDFQQTFSLLDGAFRYPEALTTREMSALIYRAVIDLRKTGVVKLNDLISAVNASASDALSSRKSRFTMWTALRLRNLSQSGGFDIRYKGVLLQGRSILPPRLRLEEYDLSGDRISPNDLSGFAFLIGRTEARNEEGAARNIFEAADLFMALTNVAWRQWNVFGGEHHAEAKLWEGPYQFFWRNKTFLGSERLWFNPEFRRDEWNRHPETGAKFRQFLPAVRRGLRKLEGHPLARVLSQALRLMHDGMVSRDSSYRLLRFWSALESIFSKENESRSDTIIDRALFAENCEDRDIVRLKLQYLSRIRNGYVHAGLENENIYHLIQFLRDFVANHLLYLLYNGDDFDSHDEYIAMCSLPSSLDALKRRRQAIQRRENVILFRRHRGAPSAQ